MDFGLDAANTASTALAAARGTRKVGEGEGEREVIIAYQRAFQSHVSNMALPVALALCVGKISLFPPSLIPLPPSPIIFSAPPPGTGLIGDALATGTGWIWESGEIIYYYS